MVAGGFDFFIRNNFVDRGISGQTTSEMLVRFRQDVINLKPKAVVILAGINDIAHNNGVIALENVFGELGLYGRIGEGKSYQGDFLLRIAGL